MTTSFADEVDTAATGFTLKLTNFEGPFDLLLKLIAKHKLDITEVALSQVTDEFIAYVREPGRSWNLDQTSSFLVVAATLLDMKAAKLLPDGEVEDLADVAAFEARDLLFAKLLQYRAFKLLAAWIAGRVSDESHNYPRTVGLDPDYAKLLPEVEVPGGAARLQSIINRLFAAPDLPRIPVEHLHISQVSVTEQAALLVGRLRRAKALTFRSLTQDVSRAVVVARFLALLELYKEGSVAFEQLRPLSELTIRWVGAENGTITIADDYDSVATEAAVSAASASGASASGASNSGVSNTESERV
ncbi:MAG: segregation/condensation protein A [Propionibacteriaceae bacterium]|jgi:segregation and condensation protein A|nr:segregation/condensation protein A [Propionibacteriaceae bacterium]